MLRLNQSFHVQTKHFWGLIWTLRGLAQKGEGTNVLFLTLRLNQGFHVQIKHFLGLIW
jgi:hypothetical protein